ncbi:uncharacterized protein [Henckelia pumila]|uniref:uncharacterized protein n=1 Tax=Henckelia pumila TaxID=405737 RepID=UPI003C6E051E
MSPWSWSWFTYSINTRGSTLDNSTSSSSPLIFLSFRTIAEEMASKVVLLVLTCFLLISTTVSSEWEEDLLIESGAHAPVLSPVDKASPPPPICPPPPPSLTAPPPPSVVSVPPTPPAMAPAPAPVKPPRTILECIPQCMVRCKNHSRKNICMRTCLTCCNRCKCVPPGQYGNKEKCGKCYTDMTTRGGKLKCP